MLLKNRFFVLVCLLLAMTLACTAPAFTATPGLLPTEISPTETVFIPPTETVLPATTEPPPTKAAPLQTSTLEVAESATLITFPTVTFERNANCRMGPAINYATQTSFFAARTTIAEGRNSDSSWLWVRSTEPNLHCWVSVMDLDQPGLYQYLPIIELFPLPEAPSQIFVDNMDCVGRNLVTLRWPSVTGETGFLLFRNGTLLTLLRADTVSYTDYPPDEHEYVYEIESINNYGLSVRVAITLQGCAE